MMKIYKVGGAVRDSLMGIAPKDQDWVVEGSTPEALLNQGFRHVGAHFPVFLHPETNEEYALARTERKTASGHTGFDCIYSPNVTLFQDLSRRDLTINSMAMDDQGQLIDPFGGQQDLREKRLRHVSPAFTEDPLRVLRTARFLARFYHQGFTIAPETLELMQSMVNSSEFKQLSAERVWQESVRALGEANPQTYFHTLHSIGALNTWFTELDHLFGIPQDPKHHPEIDTGIHSLLSLKQAAKLSQNTKVRFSALLHDLGKGVTPNTLWPSHPNHAEKGVESVISLCKRLKVPKSYQRLAVLGCRWHTTVHQALDTHKTSPQNTLAFLESIRNRHELDDCLTVCLADSQGRPGFEETDYPQANFLRKAYENIQGVKASRFLNSGIEGKALGDKIRQAKLETLIYLKSAWKL